MPDNHSHPKFGDIDLNNWVQDLYDAYPKWKNENNPDVPLPLPNTVKHKVEFFKNAKGQQKTKRVVIDEVRNLHLINTKEDLDKLLEMVKTAPVVAIDTEFFVHARKKAFHYYAKGNKFGGVCISIDPIRGYYVPTGHNSSGDMFNTAPQIDESYLATKLNEIDWSDKLLIAHNYKAETNSLHNIGVDIPFNWDTMVVAKLIDNRVGGALKSLSASTLGYEPIEYSDVSAQYKTFLDIPVEEATPYAASDPVNTYRLCMYQYLRLGKIQKHCKQLGYDVSPIDVLAKVESPLMVPLARMEQVGLSLDKEKLKRYAKGLQEELRKSANAVRSAADLEGFSGSIRSKIFQETLFKDILKIPRNLKDDSRDSNALNEMQGYVLEFKERAKEDFAELLAIYDKDKKNKQRLIATIMANYIRRNEPVLEWKSASTVRPARSPGEHPMTRYSVDVKPTKISNQMVKDLHRVLQEEIESRDVQLNFIKEWKEYSKASKLLSTYTYSLIEWADQATDGLMHTSFKQALNSGRMSTSPNMQNLPADPGEWDIRDAFLPPSDEYVFVRVDWSAMEMKVTAALSGCPVLTGIVSGTTKDPSGKDIDIHAYTASAASKKPDQSAMDAYVEFRALSKTNPAVYNKRRKGAKAVNFGILYGISAIGLAVQLGCSTKEAQKFIDSFLIAYPGVKEWMSTVEGRVNKHYFTMTAFGRMRRASFEAQSDPRKLSSEMRPLRNHEIQGTSADYAKIAMSQVDYQLQKYNIPARLVMMIHDELVVYCKKEDAYDILDIVTNSMTVNLDGITLDVDGEITITMSKTAPNMINKTITKMRPKLDDKGEKSYKDGALQEEAYSVPNPHYLERVDTGRDLSKFCIHDLDVDLISLLSPLHEALEQSGVQKLQTAAKLNALMN